MPRKAFRLLPPKKRKRRFWTVVFSTGKKTRKQCSTGADTQPAAKEFAVAWIKQHSPSLCRRLDIKPLPTLPVDTTTPAIQDPLPL